MSEQLGKEFWERRYRAHPVVRHGRPNPPLVEAAANLPPGTALDAGCGEGADAIWLASRGWRVTAVDFAATALRRSRERAETLGAAIADRIEWIAADLTEWRPTEEPFDLVSTQYAHVPSASRTALFRTLAASVAPGGTLLVVGHHPPDHLPTGTPGPAGDLYLRAEEVAACLDPDQWDISVADARSRSVADPACHEVPVRDAVLRARRRP